jgi:hypothetical protein
LPIFAGHLFLIGQLGETPEAVVFRILEGTIAGPASATSKAQKKGRIIDDSLLRQQSFIVSPA